MFSLSFSFPATAQSNDRYPSETVYLKDLNLLSMADYFWNGETSDGTMAMFMENGREALLSRPSLPTQDSENATLEDPDNNGAGVPTEPSYPPDGGKRGVFVSDFRWDSLGNHYMLGTFNDSLGHGEKPLKSRGGWDIFLAKFDAWQNLEWVQSFGGPDREVSFKLSLDSQDHPVISGQFSDQLVIGDKRLESDGRQDIFLAALTATGQVKWARRLGSSGEDVPHRLEIGENQEIHLQGQFIYRENIEGMVPYQSRRVFSAAYDEDGHLRTVRMRGEN